MPDFEISIPPDKGTRFEFHCATDNWNSSLLFTIHPDGRISFGPAFTTVDDASLKFWRAIAEQFPLFRQKMLEGDNL